MPNINNFDEVSLSNLTAMDKHDQTSSIHILKIIESFQFLDTQIGDFFFRRSFVALRKQNNSVHDFRIILLCFYLNSFIVVAYY